MASACINNAIKFSTSSFPWLSTPDSNDVASTPKPNAAEAKDYESDKTDLDDGFEFRLHDPVAMLPADELISDGKLMPMTTLTLPPLSNYDMAAAQQSRRIITEALGDGGGDSNVFSPRAPRCGGASRWKEIFGLKKLEAKSTTTTNNKSIKNFLHHRKSKSSSSSPDAVGGGCLSLPLLKDSDCESSLSISSSRLSLSSSSSGHELDDYPRLSLDSHNHNINPISLLKSVANSNPNNPNPNPPPRIRLIAKPRPPETIGSSRIGRSPMRRQPATSTEPPTNVTTYADSPRMNPSGKIVFHSLERSSSSPGSFNGGPRLKHSSGMERSYSANVRVTPVLNVPVCSLSKSGNVLGFGQLFSSSNGGGSSCRSYQSINSSSINVRRSRS